MDNYKNEKIPVLFLIFCREDITKQAFESIRNYKPERLYIAGDGPRENKPDEDKLCENTRKAVLNAIDWDCEVKTLFREQNLGCANAVYGAITWFFENEEYGIIIEDDVVVHQDFYRLCEQFLPYYKDEEQIMMITAQNHTPNLLCSNKLSFSSRAWIWGWASWRRAWAKMDMTMSLWQQFNCIHLIKKLGLFQGLYLWYCWLSAYRNILTLNSWAIRWDFALIVNNGLCLSSNVRLSSNIGITSEGTHYKSGDKDIYSHIPIGSIDWPLEIPEKIELSKSKLKAEQKEFIRERIEGIKKKVRRIYYRMEKNEENIW